MERLTERDLLDGYINKRGVLVADCLNKLGQYEDLEEQGLLLILPCKVGGKIYDIKCGYVRETTVSRYDMAEVIPYRTTVKAHIHVRINGFHKSFLVEDIGKTVFLTKAEAEQAMKEMKKCKYVKDNGLCGKNPACTSSGKCEGYCSYFKQALKQMGE